MKFAVLEDKEWKTIVRIDPLIKILKKREHSFFYTENINDCKNSDVLLIEYFHPGKDSVNEFNSLFNFLINYDGKVVLYSTDDNSYTYVNGINPILLNRIDGWITFLKHNTSILYSSKLDNKYIVLPRYNWYNIPILKEPTQRENKLFYWHSATGYFNYKNNKNLRIECLDKLYKSPLFKDKIVGGITLDLIVDGGIVQNSDYGKKFQHFKVPHLSYDKYITELRKYRICVTIPGNSKWDSRHIDAMSSKSIIISVDPRNDPGEWLFQEEIFPYLVIIKEDLSDLEEKCFYALNTFELDNNVNALYEMYTKYFQLNVDGTYKDIVAVPILNQLQKILGSI